MQPFSPIGSSRFVTFLSRSRGTGVVDKWVGRLSHVVETELPMAHLSLLHTSQSKQLSAGNLLMCVPILSSFFGYAQAGRVNRHISAAAVTAVPIAACLIGRKEARTL